MVTLSWTSLNIDSYKQAVYTGIAQLRATVNQVVDLVEQRVDKNVRLVARLSMVTLPNNASFSLDDFVAAQEMHILAQTEVCYCVSLLDL